MKHGFVRVAAYTPEIKVADPVYNTEQIIKLIAQAHSDSVKLAVFPELCLTGYTCNDLFLQEVLLEAALKGLSDIVEETRKYSGMLVLVGLPFAHGGKLYNAAAAVCSGKLLGIVPKKNLPNYGEFYEKRHFVPGNDRCIDVTVGKAVVPMGSQLMFSCRNLPDIVVGVEICEDLWAPDPPSTKLAMRGATILVNCSASNETIGKKEYRRQLVMGQSARLVSAYIYASAGEGESTQDLVFGGHNMICENGTMLAQTKIFENNAACADLDMAKIAAERRRMTTFEMPDASDYRVVEFELSEETIPLRRFYDKAPFVPDDERERNSRCEEILNIQTAGLKKRVQHTGAKSAVLGLSGGLDSTLALIVTVRTFDALGLPRKGITCVTMPCFGTTDRTYHNAVELAKKLDCTLREIVIQDAVRQHFKDIGQDESVHDVTYENAQARERTQILMDIANQTGGLVIGTGDMSELALGWATYNGDHMSMYGVNASVPKTLVRYLVRYYSEVCQDRALADVLRDILDTPVSPELLPPDEDGRIAQKTEDLVGPYELHDFFLYHMLRFGVRPQKLFRIAQIAFEDSYSDEVIYQWLRTFLRRFFAQQFKRSCVPDGPKVGSVALSPRGDLRMPSDASVALWIAELDQLKEQFFQI